MNVPDDLFLKISSYLKKHNCYFCKKRFYFNEYKDKLFYNSHIFCSSECYFKVLNYDLNGCIIEFKK